MIEINSPSSRLLYTTVRIVGETADGKSSIGTGFFFRFKVNEQSDNPNVPVLITNKHVVRNMSKGIFFVHEGVEDSPGQIKPSLNSFSITITDFEEAWIDHPDEAIDLCAMPFMPLQKASQTIGKQIFSLSLDECLIPTQTQLDGLIAMEDITMVGYLLASGMM